MQQNLKKDGYQTLKQESLTPVQKESLKSVLNSFKSKMVIMHEIYLTNNNTLSKEQKDDFYKDSFSLAYILSKYQEKDPELQLQDYILEAERIRDYHLYQPSKTKTKFKIMPKLTKEKYEQFIEYEKDIRFPSQRKTISLNNLARQADQTSVKPIQKLPNNPINSITSFNNQNLNGDINARNVQQQQQQQQFQSNNIDNENNIRMNNNNFGRFNSNQGIQNNPPAPNQNPNAKYNDGLFGFNQNAQNQNQNQQNINQNNGFSNNKFGYGRNQSYQDEGYKDDSSYKNNQQNKYQNNANLGYGRNRFNNNRFNRNNNSIEEEEDPKKQPEGGVFLTAQQAAKQNQFLRKQREEGFYNKESGRYGRSQGQLEFEGINDNKPRYGQNKYNNNNNSGVDDVVNMVHYHTLGKNINLNNQPTQSNQSVGLCGGGSEDELKKTGLSKKFKPPGAPGSNPKKNEGNDQLKGMDQKLVDLIESEIVENAANVKWDDIAGLESAKRSVHETIVWPMLNPQIFTGIRAPPRGLLLFGPPGTGKTMIGKAIACESGSTFFSISASSLTSKYIGEGEKMVKILFKLALQRQPSVIFIDEIDSLLCARTENENEASRRIKTEFLVQMEGAQSKGDERILLIGATNRPQELDDAVKRRFVKKLYIPLPNKEARTQLILRVIENGSADGTAFDLPQQDLEEVVQATKGYSGADMRNLCQEAAFIPLRQCTNIQQISSSDIRPVNKSDLLQALRQVKATVTKKDLTGYIDWNNQFGSFELNMEEIDT